MGHERARPGLDRRPPAADRDHARHPADGGGHSRRVRVARAPLRRLIRRHPGRPPRVPDLRVGAAAGRSSGSAPAHILIWFVAAGVVLDRGRARRGRRRAPLLWLVALAIDYFAPIVLYRVPGRPQLAPETWDVETAHFAERFQLFVIIALGESIVVTGATTSDLDLDAARADGASRSRSSARRRSGGSTSTTSRRSRSAGSSWRRTGRCWRATATRTSMC